MAEINAEREKMVEENGRRMRDFALAAIFFSVDFGHIRTAVETEVREKHISKNSSIWAKVGSRIQCRCTLLLMGSSCFEQLLCFCINMIGLSIITKLIHLVREVTDLF